MLKDIFDFLKREKLYTVFFVALTVTYGVLIFSKQKEEEPKENTRVVEEYKKAEDKVQTKVKDLGSLEAYLKDRPDLVIWVNIFSFLFILALVVGVVLDYLMFLRPGYRARFQIDRAPPQVDWKASLLFKFFIWFFGGNIVLGVVLSGFRRFFSFDENFYILLHTTCAEILSFVVIFRLIKKNAGLAADIGLSVPGGKWLREIGVGWMSYVAILPLFGIVLLVLLGVTELFHYEPPPHPLVPIFLSEGQHPALIFYSIFLAVFFGPIFEEVFFRGFFYPILKKHFGALTAMVITSSFFAFIHDSTFAFWPIFVLGMSLNYIYEKRGSLLANITLHITHNALFLAYFFLAKSIIGREVGG